MEMQESQKKWYFEANLFLTPSPWGGQEAPNLFRHSSFWIPNLCGVGADPFFEFFGDKEH